MLFMLIKHKEQVIPHPELYFNLLETWERQSLFLENNDLLMKVYFSFHLIVLLPKEEAFKDYFESKRCEPNTLPKIFHSYQPNSERGLRSGLQCHI